MAYVGMTQYRVESSIVELDVVAGQTDRETDGLQCVTRSSWVWETAHYS